MKNILKTIPFFLLVCFSTNAQTIKKANKQYDNLAYIDAIKTYERLADKGLRSIDLFQKLGNSYYFNANLKEANKWYSELFGLTMNVAPEYYYRYAQTLKATGDYATADKYLHLFTKESEKDTRGILFKNKKDYKNVIDKNSGRYEVKLTDINTVESDYGAALHENQFVFSSAREVAKISKVSTEWTEKRFLNLYTATRAADGTLSNPEKFSNAINSKFHEDSPIFTKDAKTVYFTRNNFIKGKTGKDQDDVVLLKLYRASLDDKGNWSNVVELPFNSDTFSVAHPALSPDEKTLYFASNMPGTKGQSDIFKVEITGDNTYSTPVSVSGNLNTEGRETFPFVTANNELYFASDGHPGLGGLDIFVSKLNDKGEFAKPINVGAPANSSMDDFAFFFEASSKTGYLSSNRSGGVGSDDIYWFKEIKPIVEECTQELSGVVTNAETGEILFNAKVTLYDETFKELETMQSDAQGNYKFLVECDKKYFVKGEKEAYETKEIPVVIPNVSGKTTQPIATSKIVKEIKVGTDLAKTLDIKMIYFDLDKSYIRADASVELEKILDAMQQYPAMRVDVRSHTDCRQTAAYNMALSDKRVKATIAWLISKGINPVRLTGRGYGEYQLVNDCGCEPTNQSTCTEEQHQANRRSEFIITAM